MNQPVSMDLEGDLDLKKESRGRKVVLSIVKGFALLSLACWVIIGILFVGGYTRLGFMLHDTGTVVINAHTPEAFQAYEDLFNKRLWVTGTDDDSDAFRTLFDNGRVVLVYINPASPLHRLMADLDVAYIFPALDPNAALKADIQIWKNRSETTITVDSTTLARRPDIKLTMGLFDKHLAIGYRRAAHQIAGSDKSSKPYQKRRYIHFNPILPNE